jgi:hypothetical protein
MTDKNFWRVEITCLGVWEDACSVVVPTWDKARHPNRVFLFPREDWPPGFAEKIKNGMKFQGDVPMVAHAQVEFTIKNIELPK